MSKQDEFVEQISDELIERLAKGTAPWQLPWTPEQGNDLPYNAVTNQPYTGMNRLALMMKSYDDPRWLTYKQAQSINGQVRKGEHGTQLIKLITHREQTKKDENGKIVRDEQGNPVKEKIVLETPFIKAFTVFNAAQIDGLPPLERKVIPPVTWENNQRTEQILVASGADVQHKGNQAYYNPTQDQIVLPHKHQFADAGLYYATALHELGHWTGHESRLDRDLSGGFGSESYAKEELRAEIASMMLTRELNLPHYPDRHAAYVGSWIKALQDNPKEIMVAARDANKIKEFMLRFEKIERTNPTQERLAQAKERYLAQTPLLPKSEQDKRVFAEKLVAEITANLSLDNQNKAWLNFYDNQVNSAEKIIQPVPTRETTQEILFER